MFSRHMSLAPLALACVSIAAFAQGDSTKSVQTRTETTTSRDALRARAEQLGWELAKTDDGLRIERITKNSPVAEAKLEEKDIITKINGENVLSEDRLDQEISKLINEKETRTEIVVLRDGKELSYLLSLESLERPAGVTRQSTTVTQTNQGDLAQMIQQLQLQSQQQQALLQTLLSEVQSLRSQLGVGPAPTVNNAPVGNTQFGGDVIAPLGAIGTPAGTAPAVNPVVTPNGANPVVNP